MTVRELIEHLQKIPNQELRVYVENGADPSATVNLLEVKILPADAWTDSEHLKPGDDFVYLAETINPPPQP